MTDDAIFLVPRTFGKEAFVSEHNKDMHIEGKSEIKELKIIGDWAYTRNHLDLEITTPKETIHKSGYTLTLFHKEKGKWKLARDANLLTTK